MLHYTSLKEAEATFKALSAPMRISILERLYQKEEMSMDELAKSLSLTNGAISMHVAKLAEAGLVEITATAGKRGTKKLVRPKVQRLMVDLAPAKEEKPFHIGNVAIGHYSACSVAPTCGLADSKAILGSLDDAKVFSYPERFRADILWFTSGYVEYNLPNPLQAGQRLTSLELSFEISSECPGNNDDYPSDIYFSLNNTPLGMWISPGDYGARKGLLSPGWWHPQLNQYGLLKTLIINKEGCFIDGTKKISDVTIADLQINYNTYLTFRFEVPKDTANVGGLTLFGEGFGDYNQAIQVKMFYEQD